MVNFSFKMSEKDIYISQTFSFNRASGGLKSVKVCR